MARTVSLTLAFVFMCWSQAPGIFLSQELLTQVSDCLEEKSLSLMVFLQGPRMISLAVYLPWIIFLLSGDDLKIFLELALLRGRRSGSE